MARRPLRIEVDGVSREIHSSHDTPLLYVLRDELRLNVPRFGCGLAQCGACSVLLDGKEIRSCVTAVSAANGKQVTTLEGLPAQWAKWLGRKLHKGELHPIQQAWIDEQVPQCGYCQSGMMIQAAELLSKNTNPTDEEIGSAMNGHLCRCGTYPRILKAIKKAGLRMAWGDG